MSMRHRARTLMRATGLSYQQAIQKIRALGEEPAQLRARTGWPLESCDRYLVEGPRSKIEVITVESSTRAELACQQLLHTTGALTVLLLEGWRVLASAGPQEGRVLFHPMMVLPRGERLPRERKSFDVAGGLHALIVPIKRLHLLVLHDDQVSALLLHKRIEKTVDYLASLMVDDPLLAPPGSGGDGPGSLSAVAWESVEIWKKKKP